MQSKHVHFLAFGIWTRLPTQTFQAFATVHTLNRTNYHLYNPNSLPQFRTFARGGPTTVDADEEFFAPLDKNSFASLGLHDRVCTALHASGFYQASHAQYLATEPILKGKDVVLAAETGSGKTLAYLAPLASRILTTESIIDKIIPKVVDEASKSQPQRHRQQKSAALVLCPNVQLCTQVVNMGIKALTDPSTDQPVVSISLISSQHPPPLTLPDIVVTTPGALVSLLDCGGYFGSEWTRSGLPEWVRYVVFDEADLLLGGGYAKHLGVIMDSLKTGDREAAAQKACAELQIQMDDYWEMPRFIRKAIQIGGAKAAIDAGYRPPRPDAFNPTKVLETTLSLPWLRQYIFVAATMPKEAGKNVGSDIVASFPNAVWLTGKQLHQARRSLTHQWRQFSSASERTAALIETITKDAMASQGKGRMLIFTKDVASANETAQILQNSPLIRNQIMSYHSGVSPAERTAALSKMQLEEGHIMVCTDAAARGVDIQDVTHVVQADFASSAIDFLHRVGRTARAGKSGTITSLYSTEAAVLVDVIRDAISEGKPVEGAFSRKRSFRKKYKRYGKYVARGEVA